MESNNNGEIQDFQLNIIQEDHQEQISHTQDMTAPQAFIFPSETPPAPSISWPPLPLGMINSNTMGDQHHRFLPPLPPLPSNHHIHQFYGDFYGRRATSTPFYDGGGCGLGSSDPLGLMGLYTSSIPSSSPFGVLHAELGTMSAQEIMDAKALAASKSHSEAERRRRKRINAHLSRLRSLLPSTTKTDKASLLAEVIQHVKELKRQMSEIGEESPLPTESDELTVDYTSDEDGRLVVRASLCCDDRADLLPDLIKALKSLRLRALKAEITTLGGRVKNVLVIAGDGAAADPDQYCVATIQEALKAVMERVAAEETSAAGGTKRQRTTNLSSILEHRSI